MRVQIWNLQTLGVLVLLLEFVGNCQGLLGCLSGSVGNGRGLPLGVLVGRKRGGATMASMQGGEGIKENRKYEVWELLFVKRKHLEPVGGLARREGACDPSAILFNKDGERGFAPRAGGGWWRGRGLNTLKSLEKPSKCLKMT